MTTTPEAVEYRLAVSGGRYRWSVGRREAATAVWRDHCWDVCDSEQGRVLVSLVAGSENGRTKVALVDHEGRRTAAFVSAERMSRADIGTVVDSFGATLMLVRADGPTGLHAIDPEGELLALSSRHRGADAHCDVLITAAGAAQGTGLMLSVILALELLRAGAIRRAA